MEPQIRTLVDISESKAGLQGRANIVLERARWASYVFQRYDRATTMEIVDAPAQKLSRRGGEVVAPQPRHIDGDLAHGLALR